MNWLISVFVMGRCSVLCALVSNVIMPCDWAVSLVLVFSNTVGPQVTLLVHSFYQFRRVVIWIFSATGQVTAESLLCSDYSRERRETHLHVTNTKELAPNPAPRTVIVYLSLSCLHPSPNKPAH